MNPAQKETEAILAKLEKKIRKEYQTAEKEVSEKLNDYLRRFAAKDEIKRDQLARGVITKKEYTEWRTGQIMMGKRWEEMRDTLAKDLQNTAEIARSIATGYMPEVYAINHNYATFAVEQASQIDTSYTLYNAHAVEQAIKADKIYHAPGKYASDRIRKGQEVAWERHRIESVMLQGIMQGESIPTLSKRLHRVTEGDYKAAIRNARTMTTGIENAGHADAYKRAADMGINVVQEWIATLDSRTRHSHRDVDGETVKPGEEFSNGLLYPGDPNGAPQEVYNCRCRIIERVDGINSDASDISRRYNANLGGMTYDEWKNGKAKSDPITKQEEIANGMRWRYINEDYKK